MGLQRPGITNSKQSRAEREIREAQAVKLQARAAALSADEALAEAIREHMINVPVAEIGTWLVSPDRPQGLSRQQVYNLANSQPSGKPKPAPKKKPKPKPKRRI